MSSTRRLPISDSRAPVLQYRRIRASSRRLVKPVLRHTSSSLRVSSVRHDLDQLLRGLGLLDALHQRSADLVLVDEEPEELLQALVFVHRASTGILVLQGEEDVNGPPAGRCTTTWSGTG
jgi:hypothetical protein